jgi:uncharacterized protein YggE
MKKRTFFQILFLTFSVSIVIAQPMQKPIRKPSAKEITVRGKSSIKVDADRAFFDIYLIASGETIGSSIENLEESIDKLRNKFAEVGVDKKDVTIPGFNTAIKNNENMKLSSSNRFNTRARAKVIIKDMSLIPQAIVVASGLSNSKVTNMHFELENDLATKMKAQELAIEAAESKAEKIAEKLDCQLSEIVDFEEISTNEITSTRPFGNSDSNIAKNYSNSTIIDVYSQQVTITSEVAVTFRCK